MNHKQIKFTGEMKRVAETQPCPRAVRSGSRRSVYKPHVGKKQLSRLARL